MNPNQPRRIEDIEQNKHARFFYDLLAELQKEGEYILTTKEDNEYHIEGDGFILRQKGDELTVQCNNVTIISVDLSKKTITNYKKMQSKRLMMFLKLANILYKK